MPVLSSRADPVLYAQVGDRNLQQQFFLLETCVGASLRMTPRACTADALLALHQAAALFLDDRPGQYRQDFVHIAGSPHEPPAHGELPALMRDYFAFLNVNRTRLDPYELAAYALWRLTWIHPFNECNGRTARAYCYLVLCAELGRWLPGRTTVIDQMKEDRDESYRLLRQADERFAATGRADLAGITQALSGMVAAQIVGAAPGNPK